MFVGQVGAEDGRNVLLPELAAQGLLTLRSQQTQNTPTGIQNLHGKSKILPEYSF